MFEAVKRLHKGNIVAIFPEGGIERNCKIDPFHRGFELIEEGKWEGVLVPFYISGMEGSLFARCKRGRKFPLPRREVKVCFFPPKQKEIKAKELEEYLRKESRKC